MEMCKKRLLYMAKITDRNNSPIVKDILLTKEYFSGEVQQFLTDWQDLYFFRERSTFSV